MGHIERRQTERPWRARYRGSNGREFNRSFLRKADAERWLRDQEMAVQSGTWRDPSRSSITVSTWLEQWLPSRRADLRATTYERVSQVCRNQIEPTFGDTRLSRVGHADVAAWSAQLQADGLSARSTRKALQVFKQAMGAAVADQRLAINPVAGVPLPSDAAPERPWMSQDQADALLDVLDGPHRVAVLLGYYCGLRFGEIVGLRRRDVDVVRSRISVERTATIVDNRVEFGMPKTRSAVRTLPVARSIMGQLDEHLAQYVPADADALVMANRDGGPVLRQNFTRRVWRPALKAAGIPEELTPHSMRHGYASWLISAGFDLKSVSAWCGHSSIHITMSVYAHVQDLKDDDDISNRLDAALKPAATRATVSHLQAVREGA